MAFTNEFYNRITLHRKQRAKADNTIGRSSLTYNYMNLPRTINSDIGESVVYLHDATGNKIKQTYNMSSTSGVKTTDFVGNFVYENGVPVYNIYDEGRIVFNADGSCFGEAFVKDHLGNVRVACRLEHGQVKVRQVNSYYPFGMNIKGLSQNSTDNYKANEYLYNGKMMQDEMGLGWLDYGARFYDAVLGRWHSVDPMAEKYSEISPYAYCANSPIRFIDPDGMNIHNYSVDENGNIKFEKKTDDNHDMLYKKSDYDKNNLTDGYKVTDKNVLPNLTTTSGTEMIIPDGIPDAETGVQQYDKVTLNTACSKKQDEMAGLFLFAANASSNAEWRLTKLKGGEMELSTFHDNDESPNDSHLGINTNSVNWMVHSHPRTRPGGEKQSFGGDGAASITYTSKNAGFYVYFPKSTNLYKFHPQNSSGSVPVSKTMTNGKFDTVKNILK